MRTTVSPRFCVAILGGGLALCGLAFVGGGLAGRVRFDNQSTAGLNRYAEAVLRWPSYTPFFMRLEQQRATLEPRASIAPWTAHLQRVDAALAASNVSTAERAWHDAYAEALRSRRWEGLLEAGDAYLRIGKVANGRTAAQAQARRAYLTALFRARNEGSLDGVLHTVEAFAALGDHEVAEQGLRIAERLAEKSPDAHARERVRAVADRLAARVLAAEGP